MESGINNPPGKKSPRPDGFYHIFNQELISANVFLKKKKKKEKETLSKSFYKASIT